MSEQPQFPEPEEPLEAELVGPSEADSKLMEGRVYVLALLFGALGPFALPTLWKSRCFTPPWKVALSVLTVLATVLAVVLLWYVLALLWYVVHQLAPVLEQGGRGDAL